MARRGREGWLGKDSEERTARKGRTSLYGGRIARIARMASKIAR